jgi:hypothetical protein
MSQAPATVQDPKPAQVAPLPIGSGGGNASKKEMNNVNTSLTLMSVQSTADSKYDPAPPTPAKPATVIGFHDYDSFSHNSTVTPAYIIGVIGILFIVYGIFKK